MFKIILFYNYTNIDSPFALRKEQLALCQKLGLKGRMIIAAEGINATLEGTKGNIQKYIKKLLADDRFKDTHIKTSDGTGQAFPKLSIKVRPEIVASGLDLNPNKLSGKYITAEKLHDWILSDKEFYSERSEDQSSEGRRPKEFYIVDMRNDYEQTVGYFENSILSNMDSFKRLPALLPKLEHIKGKTIVTVCTGGVRCEKASGFLVNNGFNDVYQLYGGIVTYLEKFPGEHFKGALYVFDGRVVMGFNMIDPLREVVGRCINCKSPSENYMNCADGFCNRHFICCKNCLKGKAKILCPMGCRDYASEHPEAFA